MPYRRFRQPHYSAWGTISEAIGGARYTRGQGQRKLSSRKGSRVGRNQILLAIYGVEDGAR